MAASLLLKLTSIGPAAAALSAGGNLLACLSRRRLLGVITSAIAIS